MAPLYYYYYDDDDDEHCSFNLLFLLNLVLCLSVPNFGDSCASSQETL